MSSFNHVSSSLVQSVSPTKIAAVLALTTSHSVSSSQSVMSNKPVTTSATNSTSHHTLNAGADNGECQLLGPFALFIQGALGLLALLSLVYKRWRERPQRPVKIWAFDASKQVVGSALLHVANLFMSMVSSGELKPKAGDFQANPCSFYLLNLAIDTTIGIPILIVLLHLFTHAFSLTPFGNPPESIQSGNYGRPAKTKWWLKQCVIYFLGLLGMKLCVYFIFQLCPWIIRVGDWALRWTEGNETIQVFFVMLFFPLVMNALQYYIIDSFIKDKKPEDHEAIPSEDGSEDTEDGGERRRQRSSRESEDDGELDGVDEVQAVKDDPDAGMTEHSKMLPNSDKPPRKKEDTRNREEYDPALDGEASSNPSDSGRSTKIPISGSTDRSKMSD